MKLFRTIFSYFLRRPPRGNLRQPQIQKGRRNQFPRPHIQCGEEWADAPIGTPGEVSERGLAVELVPSSILLKGNNAHDLCDAVSVQHPDRPVRRLPWLPERRASFEEKAP